jgi:hypothetical protein
MHLQRSRTCRALKEMNQQTMTQERIDVLESFGFVWDSQEIAWLERLAELEEFRRAHNHWALDGRGERRQKGATF